ncbi:GTPase ObgE [Fundidesulfovibrio terrae]|uniref:GTPase ObgE n=1 Tax=Fundidesulfovibrio terrae TaxID=2922866 RepID=UPI001FAEE5D6|nr:GTPase ObgE [Fundidesulfovibrio terrae]
MRFIDEAVITVVSGKGGRGCIAFRREKYIPFGGPNGGDGGKGGDVIFRVSPSLLTLYDLRLKRRYEAKNGQMGLGWQCNGKNADDLVVEVPQGTLIYELDEEAGTERLAADLTQIGEEWVAVHGGRGGKGNMHFKTSTNRAPRFAQPGEPGEEKRLRMELRLLAEVGIIGLPNAGKSTLISAVSAARPKIAPYPFTTLAPNLGVIQGEDGVQLVAADIPGLIEGAHEGQGLGHDFLKHVSRTRVLVHLLAAEETEGDDPFAGFSLVDEELVRYDPELAKRPQLRAVNKVDTLSPERLAELKAAARERGLDIRFISAKFGNGLEKLVEAMWALTAKMKQEQQG